jgi:protein-tyrosine-phosphatase
MNDQLILIVGAADTGRAPMAAALLRRLLRRHDTAAAVGSAGVVGHDGEQAEPEARDAMLALGLDIGDHVARSLTDELAAEARLLVAVDAGVARVLRARHPDAAVATLGGLAGRARDIPDPFRMQVGAWLHYAGEIEALLREGLPRLRALLADGDPPTPPPAPPAVSRVPPQAPPAAAERVAAVERAARLLGLAAELPDVVEWQGAARQLAADLAAMEQPLAPDDLCRPYVALVRAALALAPGRPAPAQAAALRAVIARLRAPVGPADLEALSAELAALGGEP